MLRTIFDIDNCLADDSRRIPNIRWDLPPDAGRWDEYYFGCEDDKPHNRKLVAHSTNPAFITARPEMYREQTEAWIKRWYVYGEKVDLLMRPNDCHRPSKELKLDLLRHFMTHHDCDEIIMAYDDKEDVVEMYREQGVPASLLRIHDVCAYTPPKSARAPDLLAAGAETFRQRNAIYGDNYLSFGKTFSTLFPDGLQIGAGDEDGFNRLGIFVQCISKMSRYAANFHAGGHEDSAHDSMVYSAMLQELTK